MNAQPMLVLNRDYTLQTLKGHSIEFKKDKPTHVPPVAYREAIAIGAVPADGDAPNVLSDEVVDTAPMDAGERNPLIKASIIKLTERNTREDFTAAGHPKVDAVSKDVGWKVGAKEIDVMLQEINDEAAGL